MRLILMPKLVRDNIPAQIRAQGGYCFVTQLEDVAYRRALLTKLVEEANEVKSAGNTGNREEVSKELADLLEVAETLRLVFRIPEQELNAWRRTKQFAAGAFAKGYKLWFAFGGKRK